MATTDARPALGFATALVRLSHVVQRVFTAVSRENGLPPQQLQLLCLLINGPVRMSELSRLMDLERPSMTGLVDRVQRRRLVARAPDPDDRRAWLVALSDAGLRLAVAAHDDVIARLDSLTADLDPADQDRLSFVIAGILAGYDPVLAVDH